VKLLSLTDGVFKLAFNVSLTVSSVKVDACKAQYCDLEKNINLAKVIFSCQKSDLGIILAV